MPLPIFSKATDASVAGHLLAEGTEGMLEKKKSNMDQVMLCHQQELQPGRLEQRGGVWSHMPED